MALKESVEARVQRGDMTIRAKALNFEAVKVSMRHTKDGLVLGFAVHPNDLPTPVVQAFLGTRYMVALVEIGDDDQPKHATGVDPKTTGERAVASAGMLCREEKFQEWMHREGYALEISEQAAIDGLYVVLGISSRSQLETNDRAREAFWRLTDDFRAYSQ